MNKYLKLFIHILGIVLSLGLVWPIVFVSSDWGINWLNHHNLAQRWYLYIVGAILSLVAGIIIGGLKDFLNNHWSETVQGEVRYNPSWGWALVALLINTALILLLE